MTKNKTEMFQLIPAVDRLLGTPDIKDISQQYPKSLIVRAINQVLKEIRKNIEKGIGADDLSEFKTESITGKVIERVKLLGKPSLRNVINATGVVVHTNLGRSILAESVLKKFRPLSGGYSNLEYDLVQGNRGSRHSHVEGILRELTSAEAAMVVNNNAAAVLISLETLAREREVVVSRGQLVEIGGSFRIPDVMKKSGANMVEVGATNKTHLKDYEEAIGPDTALLLKVHKSNFHIVGFSQDVETSQMVKLGNRYNVPVMEDLGSGCLVDISKYGFPREPTVQEVLDQGVDLVTFSGDKLLGGPQAGIILGRKDLIEAIKRNQLARALRIDKLTLLALEETLNIYRDERTALKEIPTMKMLFESYDTLKSKAQKLSRRIGRINTDVFDLKLSDGNSKVGGGAMPLLELPTRLLCLKPKKLSAQYITEQLRAFDPPVIVRVDQDNVLLDVRTIQDNEMGLVVKAIKELAEDNS